MRTTVIARGRVFGRCSLILPLELRGIILARTFLIGSVHILKPIKDYQAVQGPMVENHFVLPTWLFCIWNPALAHNLS